MKDLFKRLFMSFYPTIEGDDEDPLAGGGDEEIIKFGGIEVNLNSDPEELKASLLKAKGSYDSTSSEAQKLAKIAKEKKDVETKKEVNIEGTDIKSMLKTMIDEELKGVKAIEQQGREFNLKNSIQELDKGKRAEFKMLSDEAYNAAMATAKKEFESQPPQYRSADVYNTIASLRLSDEMRKSYGSLEDESILERAKSSPELRSQLLKTFAKELNLTPMMEQGGFTDEVSFKSRMKDLVEKFQDERSPEKRRTLMQEIAATRSQGKQFGFSYE